MDHANVSLNSLWGIDFMLSFKQYVDTLFYISDKSFFDLHAKVDNDHFLITTERSSATQFSRFRHLVPYTMVVNEGCR
jgi:hypothetical protein